MTYKCLLVIYLLDKSHGVINMVCYAVTINYVRYIPWNVIHVSLLYIYIYVGINKCVLIQEIIYLH